MRTVSERARPVLRAASIVVVALGFTALGAADAASAKAPPDPRTYSLKGKILGKSAKDWTVEWWQWANSIPWDQNPLSDESGERVAIGQRGNVWFLGGVYNVSGVAVRTATIPTNRALIFPVLNTVWFNHAAFPPLNTLDELRTSAAGTASSYDMESLIVTVDDQDIRGISTMRVAAGPFEWVEPEGGVFNHFSDGAITAGVVWPAVSDGYWCFLRPLPAGQHTIRIRGRDAGFSLDVTYELTVVDHDQP